MIRPQEVQKTLEAAFPDAWVSVEDMTGTGDHFEVVVTSKLFEGQTLIEQHRAVHRALEGRLDEGIHALKIKTRIG